MEWRKPLSWHLLGACLTQAAGEGMSDMTFPRATKSPEQKDKLTGKGPWALSPVIRERKRVLLPPSITVAEV